MKRILSIILCFVMLLAVVSSLGVTAEGENSETEITNKYKFSGGSGTKEDPYLISTAEDVNSIYQYNIEHYDLRKEKVYYRLTNDIKSWYPVSPFYNGSKYEVSSPGVYFSLGYGLDAFEIGGSVPEKSYEEVVGRYGDLYTTFEFIHPDAGTTKRTVIKIESEEHLQYLQEQKKYYDDLYEDYGIVSPHHCYPGWIYCKMSFTGVLDGDGHTIKFERIWDKYLEGFLFGSIDHGGVVKNLNFEGYWVCFAYEVGEDGLVENCTINTKSSPELVSCVGVEISGRYNENLLWKWKAEEAGLICNNYGIVRDCYNLSSLSGQIDNYGEIDAKDIYVLRLVISGVSEEPEAIIADLNMDGKIDAKDVLILIRIVAGCDPRA